MSTPVCNIVKVRIDKKKWEEFEIRTEIEGVSAQNMIRKWIDEYINGTKE